MQLIANNWQTLMIQSVSEYQALPDGVTSLVFIAEQKGPIAYRVFRTESELLIYRLNDKRLFSLPAELANVIWVE